MVHNLPENFNISDFDVFHSALMDRSPWDSMEACGGFPPPSEVKYSN